MFGMLDYRAHKLYWLIALPFRLINRLMLFAVMAVGILIAQSTSFSVPIKIAIAYVSFEAIGIILYLTISLGMSSVLNRVFFFLVDVVPAHGTNAEEARAIALTGRAFQLNKKFENDIENWTLDDTDELASLMNWRARLFFPIRDRLHRTVSELQRIYYETDAQPRSLGLSKINAIRESLPGGKPSWFEKAIVSPQIFNSLLGFVIIAAVIVFLNP